MNFLRALFLYINSQEEQYLILWENQNDDILVTCITNQCEIFNFLAKSRMF